MLKSEWLYICCTQRIKMELFVGHLKGCIEELNFNEASNPSCKEHSGMHVLPTGGDDCRRSSGRRRFGTIDPWSHANA